MAITVPQAGGYAPTPAAQEYVACLREGNREGALQVADAHWLELWYAVDPTDLRGFLESFEIEQLAGMVNVGYLSAMVGHGPTMELDEWMRQTTAEVTDSGPFPQLIAELRLQGRPAAAMELIKEAAEQIRSERGKLVDGSGGRYAFWQLQCGLTAMLSGDWTLARSWLQDATQAHRPDRFPFVVRDAAAKLAVTHVAAGNATAARIWLALAQRQPRSLSWVESLVDDSVWLAEYLCAVDALELDRAEEMRATKPSPLAHLELWPFALHAHVRHLAMTGRSDQALDLCAEVSASGLPTPDADGWLVSALDDARGIASLATTRTPQETTGPLTSCGLVAEQARLFVTGQFATVADRVLAEDIEDTEDGSALAGRPRLAARLLRAQALLRLGRDTDGRELLERTLKEISDRGVLSLLRLLTPETVELIDADPALADVTPPVAWQRLDLIQVVVTLESPLTPAETEVLRLLLRGLSRQQIADRLYLSLNTVKSQLASAYRKLGARSRTEAIERAARLGL